MAWSFEVFNENVADEIRGLSPDLQAKLIRIQGLVKTHGLLGLSRHQSKHLQDDIWEFRLKGRDNIARALYVTRTGKRIIILRVFIKKSQKTPRKELKLALERAKVIK